MKDFLKKMFFFSKQQAEHPTIRGMGLQEKEEN